MFTSGMRTTRFIAAIVVMTLSSTAAFAQDAMTVVDNYLVAWNAQDATAAANFLAEDARYYDSALGATVKGRVEAKAQVIDSFMNAVPDIYWNLVGSPVVSRQQVTFEWVLGGTNTGAWADGTPATGETFRIFGMSAFTIEGNSVVSQSDYYDALSFYKQLGIM
ncbi:ester cyclase [Kiloniella sp.]|uniref:ester cyclase n=1 Tax=Kiloniella sp. TaxID=1938587 RepID=UPI003B02B948